MMRHSPSPSIVHVRAHVRNAATLTEVLMAIFIMSIGVVSVITLFPLAILRAVHATQLTNSKVLEENIEEFINTNKWMLRGSPVDQNLITDTALTDWTSYGNVACVIDPLGEQVMSGFTTQFGNRSPAVTPTWAVRRINPCKQFTPTPLYLQAPYVPAAMTATLNSNWTVAEQASLNQFVCALPDSWVTMGDDLPANITATTVEFPIDLGTSTGQTRLTLISQDGTRSITRMGTANGTMFTNAATELDIPLPSYGLANVGRAVVDTNESRYSWIITCPTPANRPPAATCAVFFRRSFNPEEEFIYQDAGATPFEFVGMPPTPTSTVTIDWAVDDPVPLLREGNYVFDVENAFWYRIRSYEWNELARTATIEIDRPARAAGRGIIIPHGLVHVFDLELKGQ